MHTTLLSSMDYCCGRTKIELIEEFLSLEEESSGLEEKEPEEVKARLAEVEGAKAQRAPTFFQQVGKSACCYPREQLQWSKRSLPVASPVDGAVVQVPALVDEWLLSASRVCQSSGDPSAEDKLRSTRDDVPSNAESAVHAAMGKGLANSLKCCCPIPSLVKTKGNIGHLSVNGFIAISGEAEEVEWQIVRKSIDEAELEKLRKLRHAVEHCDTKPACKAKPLSRQPETLLRFLRGCQGDVKQAAKMFSDHVDWRDTFRVEDKVAHWQAELAEGKSRAAKLARRYGVEVNICMDKFGVPVRLIRLSVVDTAGFVRELGSEHVLVDTLLKLEDAHAERRRAMFRCGRLVGGQSQVIDVGDYGDHGVPYWPMRMWDCCQNWIELHKVIRPNYPETARKIFVIRLGNFTQFIWRWLMPLVPIRTQEKLRPFGAEAHTWIDELRVELEPGQVLPGFLERDDADVFSSARPRGGLVPTVDNDDGELDDINSFQVCS